MGCKKGKLIKGYYWYIKNNELAYEFDEDLQINTPKEYVDLAVRSLTMPQYAKEYQDK